jgi:hypothetical protein
MVAVGPPAIGIVELGDDREVTAAVAEAEVGAEAI